VIWYAAYGSNMSRVRFDVYLKGGVPEGAAHEYPGCRDPSDPRDVRPHEIAAELCFGGVSRTWGGGGVAFIRPAANAWTKARLYLVTSEQFDDIVAQENWLEPGTVHVDGTSTGIGSHMYGHVMDLGLLEDLPVVAVTQDPGAALNPPVGAYVRHIADGLREAYAMTPAEIEDYLAGAPGLR
jgi:hypothetical protein